MPVSVDAGGDQDVGVDHPAALADLHRQRVRGQERVRALVQGPGAEVLDVGVELLGHHRDLRLRQPGDAEGLDQLLHPPGRDPEQVAGRHHRGQRPLGPPAALEQPVGEVGALAQLGDRDLHRAGAGVEVPGPVAVAGVGPLRAALAVGGAADRVGLGRHQRLHERGQHRSEQVGLGTLQVLGHERRQVNRVGVDGHRGDLLQSCFRRSSEGSRGGRPVSGRHAHVGPVVHHVPGLNCHLTATSSHGVSIERCGCGSRFRIFLIYSRNLLKPAQRGRAGCELPVRGVAGVGQRFGVTAQPNSGVCPARGACRTPLIALSVHDRHLMGWAHCHMRRFQRSSRPSVVRLPAALDE